MWYQWISSNYDDIDLIPSNIRQGVNIFGVDGNYEGAGWSETLWKFFLANMGVALTPQGAWNNNEPLRDRDTIRFYDDWTYIRCFWFAWANQATTSFMFITAWIWRIIKSTWVFELLDSIIEWETILLNNIKYIIDWTNHRLVFDWPLSRRYYLQWDWSSLTLETPSSTSDPSGTEVTSSETIVYWWKTLSIDSYHWWAEISTGGSFQVSLNMLPYIKQT